MSEARKIAAILVSDVVGYGRLAEADEERTLARLRALRSDLIDPTIAVHHGRVVKRTGDGFIVEFRSVVEAVRCSVEFQSAMVERNAGVLVEQRIDFRVGVHLGDVVEEADGDLMGDGVNIAARLEAICEPGGIYVSGAAYEHVRDWVKETFVDLDERALKNIARPVRVYAVKTAAASITPPMTPMPEKFEPPRLSIVVLPFANMSGDPEQDYFVDGVTESLTTDLSLPIGLLVIARNTAFTYKGKAVDLKQIGRELNVSYVLEGSVQRAGGRMRVNVQLVDAETGNHLWAERFDKPVADLFDMQDEIVARVMNALMTQFYVTEGKRAERAPNPDAMDLNFQGAAWARKGLTPEYLMKARGFFERALALDPDNILALVEIALMDASVAGTYFYDDRAARLTTAEAAVSKALSLAPEFSWAHACLGLVQILTNRSAQAIAACERALSLNRNLAMAHAFIGIAKIYIGRPEETEPHIHDALRLSPRDPSSFVWFAFVGYANLCLSDDEKAVRWLQRCIDANRNYPAAHFWLAAALTHCGRLDEARSAVRAGLAFNPAFTISRFRAGAASDNATFLAQRERVYDGMRKAGVPEGEKSAN